MTEQTHYAEWQKLTPLPDEPRPDEKVGAKFVVVDEEGHNYFELGNIVELVENDNPSVPYFKRINGSRRSDSLWCRLAPLPQHKEKKVKKLIPFTDEFDWCEEGVLVILNDHHERYVVRAKGQFVWTVAYGKKPCEIEQTNSLVTHNRSDCQKVIHEVHRPLTYREFADFLQDHKGMFKSDAVVFYSALSYHYRAENESVRNDIRFRFHGTEEWRPVTTELYEIAKGLDV